MPENEPITIREAVWPADASAIEAVRHEVFVREQGVDPSVERDGRDREARHVLAFGGNTPIGTGRLLDGRIGRLAVLPQWRGRGVGRHLMLALLELAREQALGRVELHAQTHAREFYEALGFIPHGPEFTQAGIRHVAMHRDLHG